MTHLRDRSALTPLKRLAKLWPVVGVVGLRQVGKSTLIRDLLKVDDFVTFDDDDSRMDAANSPKVFLAKYPRPLVIDEIQKVSKMFDALKSEVDRKRIPGTFFVTGSQSFASGEQSRESLTGRIGTLKLFPLTLRESLKDSQAVNLDHFVKAMKRGGLPVPMFLRDDESRRLYFDSWLETTLVRDLARCYGKGYDLDFANGLISEMAEILARGEYPDLALFSKDSRKLKKYLHAMHSIFLVNRIACHPAGTGRDHWIFGDSGIAAHLLRAKMHTPEATLSLARHALYNEIAAHQEYQLKRPPITYYKSARGEPIDFVVNGTPIKISVKSSGPYGWEEKGLIGSLKALKISAGMLALPIERGEKPKRSGVSRVSWLDYCR